jgi:hypothetical protein
MIPRTWRVSGDVEVELPGGDKIQIHELGRLPADQRRFVLKESGTSSTSSGAQSLRVLSEMEGMEVDAWMREYSNGNTLYVLQEIIESPRISFTALNPNEDNKLVTQHGARMKFSVFYFDGEMTNIKFIASNAEFAVNNRDCVEGIVRY